MEELVVATRVVDGIGVVVELVGVDVVGSVVEDGGLLLLLGGTLLLLVDCSSRAQYGIGPSRHSLPGGQSSPDIRQLYPASHVHDWQGSWHRQVGHPRESVLCPYRHGVFEAQLTAAHGALVVVVGDSVQTPVYCGHRMPSHPLTLTGWHCWSPGHVTSSHG